MNDDVSRLFNEGVRHSLDAHEHRESGRTEQAEESDKKSVAAFDQALAIDPRHLGALSGKAMSLATIGQTQDAVALFQEAIGIEPDLAENRRQLGLCLLELGDIPSARKATFRALEMDAQPEYRRAAAVEIYNVGGGIMIDAAQHRDAGRRDEEVQCYVRAKAAFSLALEVDGRLKPAREAVRIVNWWLKARGEKGPPARGFWGRLFGKK